MRSAISKTDGPQPLDLQRDALEAAGVDAVDVYHDLAPGVGDDRVVYRGSVRGGAVTTPELFKAVRQAAVAAAATAEVDSSALGSEWVHVMDDLQDPDRSFMVQRLWLPEGEVACRRTFCLPTDSEIVVCDGVELRPGNGDVQLGGRASTAGAGLLELLEPVNKHGVVEELKWRPLRGKPPVSPREFTRLALEDLLFPK